MILLYIILVAIIVIVALVLIIPVKVEISFNMQSKNNQEKENQKSLKTKNEIKIYILRFIKIKTIYINDKDNTNNRTNKKKSLEENSNKDVSSNIIKAVENYIKYEKKDSLYMSKENIAKLKKGLKFEEFYLSLGFNLKNYILNAYAIAILNALINMYFSKNADHFDLQKTQYKTYISNKVIDLRFYSIINFKLVNNIIIILKLVLKLRKGGK